MLCFGRSCEGNTYISRGDNIVAEVTAKLAAWNPIWQEWQAAVPFPWSCCCCCCCCAFLCWLHPVSKDEECVETQRRIDDNLFSVTGKRNQWGHWRSRISSALIHHSFQWGIQKCYEWIKTDGNPSGRQGGGGSLAIIHHFNGAFRKVMGRRIKTDGNLWGGGYHAVQPHHFSWLFRKVMNESKQMGTLEGSGGGGGGGGEGGSWCWKNNFQWALLQSNSSSAEDGDSSSTEGSGKIKSREGRYFTAHN